MELRKGSAESVGMSAKRIQHLRDLGQRLVDEGAVSALVALVARRGTIVLEEAFGQLDPSGDAPPRQDTLFPWGSASSLITVTAAMVLVDDGLLGLNRPVSNYLPEFRGEGKERILVHHLLAHSSGIRDDEIGMFDLIPSVMADPGLGPAESPDTDQDPRIKEYLQRTYDAALLRTPNLEMSQGHHTMELLGEIVRRVSGKTLPYFARERIFDPLGMADTCFTVPKAERSRIVSHPPGSHEAIDFFDNNEVPWASFSVFTSPRDMFVLGQTFLSGGRYGDVRVLSQASVSEMTQDQVPGLSAQYREETFLEASWGLGWNIHGKKRALGDGSLQSPKAFYQGNSGGPLLWVDPVYEIVGVYFSNSLQRIEDEWPGDLFMNAVTASCED
jgi:CubicO group peptidase (beta-lactamase class C family)